MDLEEWMERAVQAVEIVGVALLAIGSIVTLVGAARNFLGQAPTAAYERARRGFGLLILLGLDVLIIAVIVQMITIDDTLDSAAALGVIVLVRTILSFSLVIEHDGVVPWRNRRAAAPAGSPSE